jgi:hypothetical protein
MVILLNCVDSTLALPLRKVSPLPFFGQIMDIKLLDSGKSQEETARFSDPDGGGAESENLRDVMPPPASSKSLPSLLPYSVARCLATPFPHNSEALAAYSIGHRYSHLPDFREFDAGSGPN